MAAVFATSAGMAARGSGSSQGLNVATTAVQLVPGLRPNVPAYEPVDVTTAASLADRDEPVSCSCNA